MNKVFVIGRLTKKPEILVTQSGKKLCDYQIAVNRRGQENSTDFISCRVWEMQAENLTKYQDKGSLICVEGSWRVDQYQDNNGNNRYKNYILVSSIEYLQSKSNNSTNVNDNQTNTQSDPFEDFGQAVSIDDNFLEWG